MEFKNCKIEMEGKASGLEEGEFSGMLSVFGNIDQGNDIVEKGAFSRTLHHKNNRVPLLWQHNTSEPIGVGIVTQEEKGLRMKGQLNLEVQRAREAHSLLKQKALKGLSIGFETIKHKFKGSIRKITEAKLWEGSVVTFPMNPRANIDDVKSIGDVFDQKGTALSNRLNSLIDAMATDDRPREDIVDAIASAAGITDSTVTQILRAEIIRPPTDRLRGFAKVLNVSVDSLEALADRDAGKGIEGFQKDIYALIGKCELLKDSGNYISDEASLRKAVAGLNALLEKNNNPFTVEDDPEDGWDDIPEPGEVEDLETVSSLKCMIELLTK